VKADLRILDMTAGQRGIWYQKENPFTIFMDRRCGDFIDNQRPDADRIVSIKPDVVAEWEHLPFKDGVFDMVVWDPPQIFKDKGAKLPGLAVKYGVLYNDSWKGQIQRGAVEAFRVLKSEGILIFKWSDCAKSVDIVLKLIPYAPMFGTRTGQSNNTHWICFIKYRKDRTLEDMSG
jgi:hypothetical protein